VTGGNISHGEDNFDLLPAFLAGLALAAAGGWLAVRVKRRVR